MGKLSRDYFCRINYAKNCEVLFFPAVANAESFQMVNSGMRLALSSFSLPAEIVLDDCGCCIVYGSSPCCHVLRGCCGGSEVPELASDKGEFLTPYPALIPHLRNKGRKNVSG